MTTGWVTVDGRGGQVGAGLVILLMVSMVGLWWVTAPGEGPVTVHLQDWELDLSLHPGRKSLPRDHNEALAKAKGADTGVFHMNRGGPTAPSAPQCNVAADEDRFDCFPGSGASAEACQARGCCWKQPSISRNSKQQAGDVNIPYCFFPSNYPNYYVEGINQTSSGWSLTLIRPEPSPWPNDLTEIRLHVMMESDNHLHFKFFDPNSTRYEVPIPLFIENRPTSADSAAYSIKFREKPFGMTVTRKSSGVTVFDTTMVGSPLIFADQFLQLSTGLGSGLLYGLGERRGPLLMNASAGWSQLSFWARDQPPTIAGGQNLYGVHPFYLELEPHPGGSTEAHGLFLLNSNAMDVELQPAPALTFRTIGGVLDFHLLMGPSPDDVVQQYTRLVGLPMLPPYWALGFHLCRYGYGSSDEVKKVIARNRALGIPYDAQWTDIDYMDQYRDWTYDRKNFADLPAIVKDLHDHNQHYVIIVDPGISNTIPGQYPPYDEGVKRGIFIKNATGQLLVGKVWPGNTVFPDWSNPEVVNWWYDAAKPFYDQVPFDGLWTDMDEPSNFVDGSLDGCMQGTLDNPPYTPGIIGGKLAQKTLCASAQQHLGSHYNLHSLYGLMEIATTKEVLVRLRPPKRAFVLTRSTFVGGGQHAAHWSGDNQATWENLRFTIPEMLAFQMFGMPMVGADVCGFSEPTTEELCTRWMQLGAFYPFMRNHNSLKDPDQDPAVWSASAQQSMKSALELRYSLLPTLYTLLVNSNQEGKPVTRPLSFQFPDDVETFGVDRQFLWGDILLISPVLEPGATSVKAYFPQDTWYDYYTGAPLQSSGTWVTLDAPLYKINVHVRGGSIFITQQIDVTTVQARVKPFGMVVALGGEDVSGELYWDDGDSRDTLSSGKYTKILMDVDTKEVRLGLRIDTEFEGFVGVPSPLEANKSRDEVEGFVGLSGDQGTPTNPEEKENVLIVSPKMTGYRPSGGMMLDHVRMLGVLGRPDRVNLSGRSVGYVYSPETKELLVANISVDLLAGFQLEWA